MTFVVSFLTVEIKKEKDDFIIFHRKQVTDILAIIDDNEIIVEF